MIVVLGASKAHENKAPILDRDGTILVEGGFVSINDGQPTEIVFTIPEDRTHVEGADAIEMMRHMIAHPDVTQLPDNEAFVDVVRLWPLHSPDAPTWVFSDNDDMQRLLSEYWSIPAGFPADVDDTHWTHAGGAPGSSPAPDPEVV